MNPHTEAPQADLPELGSKLDRRTAELVHELRANLRGEVRFGQGDRAMYATDASNYRQIPIGVVVPWDVTDVVTTVAICRAFRVPIVARGGGTSLAGQGCNAAVLIDFSKYVHHILELDPEQRFARVEPGLVLDELRDRAEEFHLTFGPDPSTHNHCTLGGMIGNNSCGVHSVMAGETSDNVEALEILTYDGRRFTVGPTSEEAFAQAIREGGRRGEIYRRTRELRDRYADVIRKGFPDLPRRVSGYNLPALLPENGSNLARALVGSEGTLVTVLEARVRLVPSPRRRVLLVLGYPSVYEAADHILEVLDSKPIGLEGIDETLVEDMKKKGLHPERVQLLPHGRGWLLVEYGGDTREEAEASAQALLSRLASSDRRPSSKIFEDPREEEIIWKVRESGLGATARVPGEHDTWEGWEDSSVPPARLGEYLRAFRGLLDRYGYRAALYGHFGQGCLHTRLPFGLRDREGIANYRSFIEDAADLVLSFGGSLSGEHGDGQSRAELLPKMFGPELMRAFGEFKAIWDPDNRMNPGKVVQPYRLDENLRLGTDYRPAKVRTHFQFPDDDGLFSRATERCVGVGECRKLDTGTMCPSYMVTREEKHSTRGRARLLFEMMRGDAIRDGWKSEAVRESLDLCLSCKGCKGECPMNVDIATYKAEFLSHYYEGRLRPASAYAFGLIYWWARLGSLVPRLTNAIMQSPLTSRLMKQLGGIDPRRTLPTFARQTFADWWRRRPAQARGGPQVLLWIDTFNNHWQPEIAISAVEVLEAEGIEVVVPGKSLCCGRPLYDYGMLNLARRQLRQILDALRPSLRAGIPVVGLEPSCVSVFRDELPNLFPDDEDAKRLAKQTFMLGDFLQRRVPDWMPPQLARDAIVQGHCHHKAVLGFEAETPLFAKMGMQAKVLDSGCCGMAGGFGYEQGHYEVSVACGERRLLPAVRQAEKDTLIVADGFSCREQIRQETGREALHTAQLLALARAEARGERETRTGHLADPARAPRMRIGRRLLVAALGFAAGWALVRRVARAA